MLENKFIVIDVRIQARKWNSLRTKSQLRPWPTSFQRKFRQEVHDEVNVAKIIIDIDYLLTKSSLSKHTVYLHLLLFRLTATLATQRKMNKDVKKQCPVQVQISFCSYDSQFLSRIRRSNTFTSSSVPLYFIHELSSICSHEFNRKLISFRGIRSITESSSMYMYIVYCILRIMYTYKKIIYESNFRVHILFIE